MISGYFIFSEHKKNQKIKISDQYNSAITEYSDENKEKIKKECSTMKTNRLIFPHQLRILYNCFDNN